MGWSKGGVWLGDGGWMGAAGPVNLLLQPNNLVVSPWSGVIAGAGVAASSVVTAPGGLLAPDGTSQAFQLTLAGAGGTANWQALYQIVTFPPSTSGSFAFFMKSSASGGATNVSFVTNNNIGFGTGLYQNFLLTSLWQKYTLSGIIQTGGTAAQFIVGNLLSAGGTVVDPSCNGNIDICFGSVTNP